MGKPAGYVSISNLPHVESSQLCNVKVRRPTHVDLTMCPDTICLLRWATVLGPSLFRRTRRSLLIAALCVLRCHVHGDLIGDIRGSVRFLALGIRVIGIGTEPHITAPLNS